MQEENEQKRITEEAAQTLLRGMKAMAEQTPFATAEIKRLTDEIIGIVHRNIAARCASLMVEYYKCKWKMIFAKWPMRMYRRIRARRALSLYRNAFHILEEFKRRFGDEEIK